MRCEDIMKRRIQCTFPTETVQLAAQRMRDENVGFLPVCDTDKRVIGTITDRDLAIRVLADGRAPTTRIHDILTPDVVSCRPEDGIEVAEQLMATHHKSRILCIDQAGQLAGVISLSDIAQQAPAGRASQTLRDISEREASS
jgi:CBS domain-containing protein